MSAKRNTASARLHASATAYARLSQKSARAGNQRESAQYQERALLLRRQAYRAAERERKHS